MTSRSTTSTGTHESQLDPDIWEMPGAMPEIVPSPDFGANIDRLFTERSMVLQAWGAYGVLWPGGAPVAGRLPRSRPGPAGRGAAAAAGPAGGVGQADPARRRRQHRRVGEAAGQELRDRGPASRGRAADHRCRGAAWVGHPVRCAWTASGSRQTWCGPPAGSRCGCRPAGAPASQAAGRPPVAAWRPEPVEVPPTGSGSIGGQPVRWSKSPRTHPM